MHEDTLCGPAPSILAQMISEREREFRRFARNAAHECQIAFWHPAGDEGEPAVRSAFQPERDDHIMAHGSLEGDGHRAVGADDPDLGLGKAGPADEDRTCADRHRVVDHQKAADGAEHKLHRFARRHARAHRGIVVRLGHPKRSACC